MKAKSTSITITFVFLLIATFLSPGFAIAQDDDILQIGGGGGRTFPGVPARTCDFQFAIDNDITEKHCVGDILTIDAVLVAESQGPGSYVYDWEVVGGSQLQLLGQNDLQQVQVQVTGAQSTNTLKLVVTRTGCNDAIPFNNGLTYLTNIDSDVPIPSVSLDLGTCGGFPSQHPHWNVLLTATPPSQSYTTVWSGTNINFLNPTNPADPTTADYGLQFEPLSAGGLSVFVSVYNQCGASNTASAQYDTDDCDDRKLNRLRDGKMKPLITSNAIVRGESLPFDVGDLQNVSVQIVNTMGQEILNQPLSGSGKLATDSFARGLLIIRLYQGEKNLAVSRLLVR
ncbi:MAG: hypothetical protein AAF206_06155 [Bacteroidota bacterium]